MNKKIKKHLENYCRKQKYNTTELEALLEGKEIFSKTTKSHRWYDAIFRVVEVDGMLIGYDWFYMTGDNSPSDMDLEFDVKSVCEVVKRQKVIDYYEEK